MIECPPNQVINCTTPPSVTNTGIATPSGSLCVVLSTDTLSGSLTTDDPVARFYTSNGGTCSTTPNDKYYDAWRFVVSETDTYTFTGNFSGDGMAGIYTEFFDPIAPCDRFITGDDNSGPGSNPLVMTNLLAPGTYVLVSSTVGTLQTMDYGWSISSAGSGFVAPTYELTYVDQFTQGSCTGAGTIDRTWIAEDACENVATCIQTITVVDFSPPQLSCPADVTVACSDPLPPAAITSAIDACFFPEPNCDQGQSTPGFPSDPGCEAAICAADPFCCDVVWDGLCAAAAASEPACCGCLETPTCGDYCDQPQGTPGFAADPECEAAICAADPFCCDVEWDAICAAAALDEPECCECLVEPTCEKVPVTFADSAPSNECPARIVRTYTAIDDCGNVATCTQYIYLEDTEPPTLFVPADITVECPSDTDPGISGQAIGIDNCGQPTVSYTDFYCATEGFVDAYAPGNWAASAPNGGSVVVNGGVVLTSPNGSACGGGQSTTYSIVVPEDGKLVFGWSYITSDSDGPFWDPFGYSLNGTFNQLTDNGGPDMQSGMAQVLVNEGDIFAFDANSVDCIFGSAATTVIDFFVFTCANEPPPGVFWPTDIDRCWAAVDACGQTTLGLQHITIQDLELPSAICNQSMAVPVDAMGMTQIPAEAFDGGSSDNCGFVFFKARRMDAPDGYDCFANGNDQYQFDDVVKFCCEDIPNNEIMVVLRVYEHEPDPGIVSDDHLEGHWVECMVRVEVQDKIAPEIECPTDLTVSCEFPFDPDNLSVFGSVADDPADREEICIDDPGNPNTIGLTCIGLDGLASDNCSMTIEELPSINVDSVCGTGHILRTFTTTDNGGLSASCQQWITFVNFDPFSEEDIDWPDDFTTTDICMVDQLDPDDLTYPYNEPVLSSDGCDLVTFTYDDVVYDFSNSSEACFKILRTWSVIDWCQFESNNGQTVGLWTDVQVIKVHNTVPPEILTRTPDQTICTDDPGCGPGNVVLNATGSDDCTDEEVLKWRIRIDWDDNGSFDDISPAGTGNAIEYATQLPLGTHRVLFTIEDLCGNMTTEESFITMISCKTPTPVCQHVTTTLTPMGNNAMATIWASDLDASSYHDCGYAVSFAFDSLGLQQSMTFDCDDIGTNAVPMYVIDENGLWDFCTVMVTVVDHSGTCTTDDLSGTIAGMVTSSGTMQMSDVMIQLHGSGLNPEYTDAGSYAFPAMPFGGSYSVEPVLDANHKQGVSTIDLIKIQKHLLGIELLESPYKVIAADANRSGSISAVDILELKKLILGLIDELPSNTSWRFVDADYVFPDGQDPLQQSFPESYEIDPFMTDMLNVDFVGIKVGDVNESSSQVNSGSADGVQSGRMESIELTMRDVDLAPGEEHTVVVKADQLNAIGTMQFTLTWDPSRLQVLAVEPGDRTRDRQWNDTRLDEGVLPFSWHTLEVPGADADQLFTLRVRALDRVAVSEVFELGSAITPEEGSLADGAIAPLDLKFDREQVGEAKLKVYQNVPNPFAGSTVIPFVTPDAGPVQLLVYDAFGVLLHQQVQDVEAGYHEFHIQPNDIKANGLLIYTVKTTNSQATNRMLIVNE
ncbi:MAG: dockerin type I domain-containing protein [Saprospiraceae bacterium]|nr:dockerin type I domain-containing protein [Saprospiraceae bacterium]